MTPEHRKQIDALIAAGEGFADDRIVVLSDGMESMYPDGRLFVEGAPAAVEYCAQAANARPALKALVARVAELEGALRDIQKHIETAGGSAYARLSGTWNIAQKALNKGNNDA